MTREPIPVVLFACNRPDYLRRAVDSILRHDDEKGRRIIISQDGTDAAVTAVVQSYGTRLEHMSFRDPPLSFDEIKEKWVYDGGQELLRTSGGYFRISQHYEWALRKIFAVDGFEHVIVLEDDIEVAPDFFSYFRATLPLLARDPTIWTISAWNDNGFAERVSDPGRLSRTDFFPGLGWLLTRQLWSELDAKWPIAFWDDWMRIPAQRQGRSTIYPEISRTYTFGREGTSPVDFFDAHLDAIKLNDEPVDFEALDLSHLIKERFDPQFHKQVADARLIDIADIDKHVDGDIKILYHGKENFDCVAKQFGLLGDFRVDLPRTSYQGIVSFHDRGRRIYLASLDYMARR